MSKHHSSFGIPIIKLYIIATYLAFNNVEWKDVSPINFDAYRKK